MALLKSDSVFLGTKFFICDIFKNNGIESHLYERYYPETYPGEIQGIDNELHNIPHVFCIFHEATAPKLLYLPPYKS